MSIYILIHRFGMKARILWSSVAVLILCFVLPLGIMAQQPGTQNRNDSSPNKLQEKQAKQPPTQQPQQRQQPQGKAENARVEQMPVQQMPVQGAGDENPSLGVLVAPSPGQGVYVAASVWGSPASAAGIRVGDYIMSVNDAPISTPAELKSSIEKLDPGTEVNLGIWRHEQTLNLKVKLAHQGEQMPESHRAWLGVILTPNPDNSPGVKIAEIFPNSPAEESGLQEGDIITRAGDKEVSGINSLLECMEHHAPGSGCDLTVVRSGQTKNVQLKLGDLEQAPMEWTMNAFRAPMDISDFGNSSNSMPQGEGDLRTMLDQLRQQVSELERRLDSLEIKTNHSTPTKSGLDTNPAAQ